MKKIISLMSPLLVAPMLSASTMLINIAPYSPGKEAELAKDMIEYTERTGNDLVLYSLSFHAEGRPAIAKSKRLLESYRELKRLLAGSPVKLGILLQSTLGHWPIIGDGHEKWVRTKTLDGDGIRFCPLDPGHREFIRETMRLAAAEKPVLMMTDDDVTGFKHTAECFCPLHLAEFERRTGKKFTCDELRKIVKEGKDKEMVDAFNQLQEDTIIGFAKLIREAVDSVDPTINICACMPWGEPWRAGRTAQALAAKGQSPVLRICNGQYSEFRGDDFAERILTTQFLYNLWKKEIPTLLDESDTFPHNLWSKSSRSFHAKLAASYFCGLKGGKLWYVNAHNRGYEITRNYTDILADHSGYYEAIAAAVEGAEPLGVFVPAKDDPVQRPSWGDYGSGWVMESFGIYGIPFRVEGDYSKDGVWALSGADMVTRRLSKADLEKILSHRVLIDGQAAEALAKLGYAELIGVRAEPGDLAFNYEKLDNLAVKLLPSDHVPVLKPLEGAKALTQLMSKDAASGAEQPVAPGATVFTNKLGGKVVVSAWHPAVEYYDRRSEPRKLWVGKMLDELAGDAFTVRSADMQDTLALAARAKDGSTLVQVFNLNYDPLDEVSFKVSAPVKSVEYLDNQGKWIALKNIHQKNGIVTLAFRLEMMEGIVVRLR